MWDVRLRPYRDDADVFENNEFAAVFTECCNTTLWTRAGVQDLWQRLHAVLAQGLWPGRCGPTWKKLVLDVVWLRGSHKGSKEGEELALKLLHEVQRGQGFHPYGEIPADFCWFNEIGLRETFHNDPDAGERLSDWETDKEDDDVSALPTKPLPTDDISPLPEQLPYRGPRICKISFLPTPPAVGLYGSHLGLSRHAAMLKWASRVRHFKWRLRIGLGLLSLLHDVCERGNLLETSHQDVETSFRWHDWKTSYAEMISRWVSPTLSEEEYESCFEVNCESWLVPCLRTLNYSRINGWNPTIIYRHLMSLGIFNIRSGTPSSLMASTPRLANVVRETHQHRHVLKHVKREVCRPPYPDPNYSSDSESALDTKSEPESETESEPESDVPPPPSTLSANQKRSSKRTQNKKIKAAKQERTQHTGARVKSDLLGKQPILRLTSSSSKPTTNALTAVIYGWRSNDLVGGALTCAPEDDRLRPKRPLIRKKGSKRKPLRLLRYYHPFKDLGMISVRPRPKTQKRCGKDIVKFMWKRDGDKHDPIFVGGVQYSALTKRTWRRLVHNHWRVKVRAIRRRETMEAWAYGSMTASGNRQASGGKLGDIYGPYARHQGHTPDDIKALFRHAVDADVVAEVGGSIHPGLKAQLKAVAESGIKRFGRFGMSTFYCNNYISLIHGDLDIGDEDLKMGRGINDSLGGYYPCIQLEKKNCGPDDYSFAYVRWGVVIETRPNTMWVFNGRHEHGTVMPSQSAMNSCSKPE
ncbi:hypothetical protein B0H17DRAFT_1124603 [Mycena rosella]|uniref:Uncharacterized protein n=1 Tax=Mycena rosella TaxID=1033263 RepID=A0AAD7GZX6_MYCRO|nr:hypothetical protein B0H17DRAFT_1124603 [Mycena rosella]